MTTMMTRRNTAPAPWTVARRLADYVFRVRIPGRYHNLTSWWGR